MAKRRPRAGALPVWLAVLVVPALAVACSGSSPSSSEGDDAGAGADAAPSPTDAGTAADAPPSPDDAGDAGDSADAGHVVMPVDPFGLSPFAAYVAADAVPDAGSGVTSWPDHVAPGAGDLVNTGAAPTYIASNAAFANRPTLAFPYAGGVESATATRWTFLHDGTSYTYWYVGRLTGTSSVDGLFDTNAGTGANAGVGFYADMTAPDRNLVYAFSDATGAGAQFFTRRTAKALLTSAPVIITIRHNAAEGLRVRVNGVESVADSPRGPYGVTPPARGLHVGQNMEIAEFGFIKAALPLSQLAGVEAFVAKKYAIPSPPTVGRRAIFWCGDSLVSDGPAYPDDVRPLLSLSNVAEHLLGVNGSNTAQMILRDSKRIDAFFDKDAAENIAINLEGMNDVRDGATIQQAVDHMKTWSLARRAAGFKVIIVGMTPNDLVQDPDRAIYNAGVEAGVGVWCDAIAPVHHDPTIGQDGQNANTTYFVDGRHLTAEGDAIVGSYVAAALNALK